MRSPWIVPSVLNADPGRLFDEVRRLDDAGVDAIQWDVMDGHFVPNLTFGPAFIKACRDASSVPFEAHLMIEEPQLWTKEYVEAGCETVIVQVEACVHLHRALQEIRGMGARAGVALNPHTPLESVRCIIDSIDHLLVMTVNPGFGGQAYIAEMEAKIADARRMIDATGRDIPLEVDGGIAPPTIGRAGAAGADTFVVGSALFRHPDGIAGCVAECRANLSAVTAGNPNTASGGGK